MSHQPSTAALAAKSIRKGLKAKGITAKVGIRTHSSVSATLFDPSPKEYEEAQEFCKAHQFGHFCGMTDIYVNSNVESDLDQIEYVFVKREFSDEVRQGAIDALTRTYNLPAMDIKNLPKTVALHRHEEEENTLELLHNILIGHNFPIVHYWKDEELAA